MDLHLEEVKEGSRAVESARPPERVMHENIPPRRGGRRIFQTTDQPALYYSNVQNRICHPSWVDLSLVGLPQLSLTPTLVRGRAHGTDPKPLKRFGSLLAR